MFAPTPPTSHVIFVLIAVHLLKLYYKWIFHYPLTSFISYTLSAETGPDHSKCSTTKLSGQVNNSNEPLTFKICDLLIYGYMESGRILGELTLKFLVILSGDILS